MSGRGKGYRGKGRGKGNGRHSDKWCYICGDENADHEAVWCPLAQCYFCHSSGHLKPVCDEYFCYRCQKQGHIAKNCPELLGETSNSSEQAQSGRSSENSRNSERNSEIRNSEAENTEPRKLEVQETTPQTEGASAQSSQTGASSSGNSENLRKRQSRAPVSVENNAKKMMLAVKHFEASLDTRGLDKKIQDLERTEANMRRDFEEKMEKIKKTREQLLRQKAMASELHEHYAALQKSASHIVDVLGIDIPEVSSQSTSQPAVTQSEIPVVSQPEIPVVTQPEIPIVSQVMSQTNTLTTSVLTGGGLLSTANLVIPVIPAAHPVEPVRQVDNVSPVHNLDTPEREIQENVISSSPLTKRGSDDEMSIDDAILDEKEDVKLKQINHSA